MEDTGEPQPPESKKSLPGRFASKSGVNERFFWTTFWVIVVFVVLQIPLIIAGYNKEVLAGPALLWSLGYLMLGILLGFVFAVPTILNNNNLPQPQAAGTGQAANNGNGNAGNDATPAALNAAAAAKGAQMTKKKIAQANTNLTQISDWLTKILVGAGLTQLNSIPGFIKKASYAMAKGLAKTAANIDYAAIFSGGIIILFLTFGFIAGYLIMRIILTGIFADDED